MIIPQTANQHTPTQSERLKAALTYAHHGWPVFPCRPGGKEPLTRRGHLDATTDPRRITAWWNRWPDANIGIPTGERSGILGLDVDHPPALESLEAELGKLPETRTHATGSGGMHLLYCYPAGVEVRNSAGKLGFGLDVRGEGGYIIVPPSTTTRPYQVLDDLPLADPPAWLIEALREPQRGRDGGASGSSAPITTNLDGPSILEGQRDDVLTRIAGKLHDGTRTLDQLAADLLAINEARCNPPLLERQVQKIARSIHARPPCKPSPQTTPETAEALAQIEASIEARDWPGMAGRTARSVAVALIKLARRHGERVPSGVRVSVSYRALALAAAVSNPTLIKAIRNLRIAGIIRKDDSRRRGTQAGAFVLLTSRANVNHSNQQRGSRTSEEASGKDWRAPYTSPRLRWSAPEIKRLGKTCEHALDALESAGGELTLEDLYGRLYPDKSPEDRKRWRPRDLTRKQCLKVRPVKALPDRTVVEYELARSDGPITRLVAAGVVECRGDTVALTSDWLEALNCERERSGEIAATRADMFVYKGDREDFERLLRGERLSAEERDRQRYARQQEAYRLRHEYKADRALSEREMHHRRESYPERRRQHIQRAIARLFAEKPEYRGRRVGQIACELGMRYIEADFPLGPDGYPKDAEVAELLDGVAA